MKIKIINLALIILLISGFFIACENTDDISIIPQIEEPQFKAGNERAELEFYAQKYEGADEIVIFWNNLLEEKIIPTNADPADSLYVVLMDNITEGDIEFNIYVRDGNDNKSQLVSLRGTVYGESYQGSIENKLFDKSVFIAGDAVVDFLPGPDGVTEFEIEYVDNEDAIHTLLFQPHLNTFVLPNAKVGSKIKYRAHYLPEPNAIDIFYTAWKEVQIGQVLLTEFTLDKSLIIEHHLTNDEPGTINGGSVGKLFDDIINDGNHFHTGPAFNNIEKMTFTFDLGQSVILSNFRFWARPYFPDRMMKEFDIWATNDITNADTSTPSIDFANWESEMVSKGWTKVASLETPQYEGDPRSYSNGNLFSAPFPIEEDRTHTYQYIRIMVKSTFVPSAEFNLGEIDVFGKQ